MVFLNNRKHCSAFQKMCIYCSLTLGYTYATGACVLLAFAPRGSERNEQ